MVKLNNYTFPYNETLSNNKNQTDSCIQTVFYQAGCKDG